MSCRRRLLDSSHVGCLRCTVVSGYVNALHLNANKTPKISIFRESCKNPICVEKACSPTPAPFGKRNPHLFPKIMAKGNYLFPIVTSCSNLFWTDQDEILSEGIFYDISKNLVPFEVKSIGANDCLNAPFGVENTTHPNTITSVIKLRAPALNEWANSSLSNPDNIGRTVFGGVAKELGNILSRFRE